MDLGHWILSRNWAFLWNATKAQELEMALVRMGITSAGNDSEALGIVSGNAWVSAMGGTIPKTRHGNHLWMAGMAIVPGPEKR
jgi:hypothetical protein